jgi:hypothetical protein
VDNALLLPLAAVFLRPSGPVAFRRRGAGFEAVSLKLGRAQRGQVEVLAGLSEGDQVSTRDLERSSGDRG